MENEQIILTPMQVQGLEFDLKQAKLDLEIAQTDIENYRKSEANKTGWDDYTVLDNSYYERIASLATRIFEIECILGNYILAAPTGNRVQVGSIVELADRDLKFVVVQNRVTKNSEIKEVSMESPIFGAIYMHKAGDICEYTVNGKLCKCVIGSVDNTYTNEMALELTSESTTLDHGVKIK